jgi:hypothetical protein
LDFSVMPGGMARKPGFVTVLHKEHILRVLRYTQAERDHLRKALALNDPDSRVRALALQLETANAALADFEKSLLAHGLQEATAIANYIRKHRLEIVPARLSSDREESDD